MVNKRKIAVVFKECARARSSLQYSERNRSFWRRGRVSTVEKVKSSFVFFLMSGPGFCILVA
jgi:hypothetical protein